MKYLLLIYENEAEWNAVGEADQSAEIAEYVRFTEDIRKSGNYVSEVPPEPLAPVAKATTVRVRNGRPMLTESSRPGTLKKLPHWRPEFPARAAGQTKCVRS